MKIYFTASARGKKQFNKYYHKIYKTLSDMGHTHLDSSIEEIDIDNFYEGDHKKRIQIYKKAMNNIKKTDIVVLEVSLHSLSMGFVMQKALESGRPVIALHLKNCDPYFASGIENDKLQVLEYGEEDLQEVLKYAINYASDQQDTRFNFFISPKHQNYLDWIAKNKKIPRSVYLRKLIEADMEKDEEFNEV